MVNLDLYRVFYTVARCGSLTKAAEELYISQPAVSQAIKTLETQLGTPLFKRMRKGMELTAQGGELVYGDVEKAVKLLSSVEDRLMELRETATGTLRIGMDILYREGVTMQAVAGHGGYFKTRQTGAKYMAAALGTPVRIMETAGEGGPWGMALLAAYMIEKKPEQTLPDYLDTVVFADAETLITEPTEADRAEFDRFLERYKKNIEIEKTAATVFSVE